MPNTVWTAVKWTQSHFSSKETRYQFKQSLPAELFHSVSSPRWLGRDEFGEETQNIQKLLPPPPLKIRVKSNIQTRYTELWAAHRSLINRQKHQGKEQGSSSKKNVLQLLLRPLQNWKCGLFFAGMCKHITVSSKQNFAIIIITLCSITRLLRCSV